MTIPDGLQWVADELDNWSRWGRERVGPEGVPEPSIWDAWITFKHHVAGWGLTVAEKLAQSLGETVVAGESAGPPPIDHERALTADRKMMYLRDVYDSHYRTLKAYFYDWEDVPEEQLHKSMRFYSQFS